MADITDYIHQLRLFLDRYQPGLKTVAAALGPGRAAAYGGASQGDILTNHVPKMVSAPDMGPKTVANDFPFGPAGAPWALPQSPTSTPTYPQAEDPMTAGGNASQPMPPVQGLDLPMAPKASAPAAPPVAAAPNSPQIPMPQPRPEGAPSGDMGFFQRNAAMMRDPVTGDFIDPAAAAKAVTGPQLIQKFMDSLHNRA